MTESEPVWAEFVCWTNADILNEDGSVYFAVSDPTPVYLPEVLFDGEATTIDSGYGFPACTINVTNAFVAGDTVRITINGVSDEYTFGLVPTCNQVQVGNAGLNGNDLDAPDDGGDWLLAYSDRVWGIRKAHFYTRTAVTYHLKIERVV